MRYKTGKRARIIEFLSENADRSYTLEEICAATTDEGHGKSTVYRLVSELVGEGRITRLSDGRTRHFTYQYVGGELCHTHLHLKCKGCGKLMHLDKKVSESFERAVELAGGFHIDDGAFLFGTCRDCKEVQA